MSNIDGIYLQPKNTMPQINELWAFMSVDAEDGNEGLIAANVGDAWIPLIAADKARLADLRPHAERVARETGAMVKLVKFTTREEVETLCQSETGNDPDGTGRSSL